MATVPDASECLKLAKAALQQASSLPTGPEKESLQSKAREHEDNARSDGWRASSLRAPD